MENEELDQNWQKIKEKLFTSPKVHSTEDFVTRVMQKIEGETEVPDPPPKRIFKWAVPVLGFGLAGWLLLMTFQTKNEVVTTDDLLFTNGFSQTYSIDDMMDL
jgi:hypothetical protein